MQAFACSTKNEKSKGYCKADLKQRILFFITIFRLCQVYRCYSCMQWPIPAQAEQAAQAHYGSFKSFKILVVPCKGIRILVQSEVQEILLVEWGIVGFGVRNKAQGIWNSSKNCTLPERKNNKSSPGIRNPWSGIQNLGARSIQPKFRPVRPGKEDHLKRWTSFFETFPVGPNRSIEFWTEISGNFGWMDRALGFLSGAG